MYMKKTAYFLFLVIIWLLPQRPLAQVHPPFWNDIQKFKKQDSASFPKTGQVLFIGSSSFTMWRTVNEDMPGFGILNKAFGGSTIADLIRYRYEVLYPYNPRQIVMYCGENDFAASDTVTVDLVFDRFKTFYRLMRDRYPTTPFAYVSMKPSPSRARLMPKYSEANALIKDMLASEYYARYVDTYTRMLKPNGQPMDDIFIADKLHMNAKGYAIWKDVLQPVLIKE